MSVPAVRSSRSAIPTAQISQPRADPQSNPASPESTAPLEAVADVRAGRRRSTIFAGAVGAALVASVFAVVAMHVHMAQNQFGLKDLEKSVAAQQQQNLQLKNQLATALAPDRIVTQAKHIGLVIPDHVTPLSVKAPVDSTKDSGDATP